MSVFHSIKNFIYLLLAVFVGYQAINFSLYGLLVNMTGSSLYEVPIDKLNAETLESRRYLRITDVEVLPDPVVFADDRGRPVMYVYALYAASYTGEITDGYNTKVLIESENKIESLEDQSVVGLLTPYWSNIDPIVVQEFGFTRVSIGEDCYYLEVDSYPLQWYWYVLILAIATLFFYRMIEAILKTIRQEREEMSVEGA